MHLNACEVGMKQRIEELGGARQWRWREEEEREEEDDTRQVGPGWK